MTFFELNKIVESKFKNIPHSPFTLRIHRAVSWGLPAEKAESLDEKFVFYWISFNSIYGGDFAESSNEKDAIAEFFIKICKLDTDNVIKDTLYSIQNPIRTLLDNKYVYNDFWNSISKTNTLTKEQFESKHALIKELTYKALIVKDDQAEVLRFLFNLIYLLRNQIFHGSSTYNGHTNREQLKSSCLILESILPIITEIVFKNENEDWGNPLYPVQSN